MAIGAAQVQTEFLDAAVLLGEELEEGSVFWLLAHHGHRLFPDGYFADLFKESRRGRPTVPARVVATVMVLQALEGLSDREAVDRLKFDIRWRAAAGLTVEPAGFHPTVLVGMRNRLRDSDRPKRLFADTRELAKALGLARSGVRAVDSTPLFDAVATQDTVTQLRAVIRKVLATVPAELAWQVRSVLDRDDDYATLGKPPCDWDDPAARAALVDALVGDALAALAVLDGQALVGKAAEAAELLALVAGQDVAQGEDGVFRIVRGVARDRVISIVDPQARHGHKSQARRFDGYKTHVAIDPDDEIITEALATPANTPDRDVVDELVDDLVEDTDHGEDSDQGQRPVVVGDSAYADAATRTRLEAAGVEVVAKVPPARNSRGGFTKDAFTIDTDAGTVTCPARHTVAIRPARGGGGRAVFTPHCAGCPIRAECTTSRTGRIVTIHRHEALLQQAKAAQHDPGWQDRYRAARPVVERAIAHFARRLWGGRKARCRGTQRINTDVATRAGALNLARLATLGLSWGPQGWQLTTP
jgi:hypothetical protein